VSLALANRGKRRSFKLILALGHIRGNPKSTAPLHNSDVGLDVDKPTVRSVGEAECIEKLALMVSLERGQKTQGVIS
jgi:hypothetical protein